MMDSRVIRPARTEDLAAIQQVMEAARQIMRDSGNPDQWGADYPSEERIRQDMDQGGSYVFEEADGRIVGYFALLPSPEPTYAEICDGAWLEDAQPYHVLHRLASYPEVHGIFRDALDFSFSVDPNIRIDTHRDNRIMRHNIGRYRHGDTCFSYCGIIHLDSGDERLAYQSCPAPSSVAEAPRERAVWVDWMRVAACFMVMLVHSVEPFYLGGEGAQILTRADAFWAAIFDSFARACVPLFIVASSFLQFPLHYPTREFFRRRAVRILIPFAVWTAVYALVWGEPAANFKGLLLNFNYAAGHLWFVYMLAGLYLIMPLLSPWAERVGRRELRFYLGIWLLTTLLPLVRDWASGGQLAVTYGPFGLPRQALYPLYGEASWNAYGLFYYLSGMAGYLLLGLYFRKFVPSLSWSRTLAVALPSFLAGFAIAAGGFLRRVAASGTSFPVGGPVDKALWWETTWCNDTLGVALMTIAWILLFRKVSASGTFFRRVLLPVSKASYGMYLGHLLVLAFVSGQIREMLGVGTEGRLGFWTSPVEIVSTAALSFAVVAGVCVLLQRIPKIGKYLVG